MTTKITKGPTFYDEQMRDKMREYEAALHDVIEYSNESAAKFLAGHLTDMEDLTMSARVAEHHVWRLAGSMDDPLQSVT